MPPPYQTHTRCLLCNIVLTVWEKLKSSLFWTIYRDIGKFQSKMKTREKLRFSFTFVLFATLVCSLAYEMRLQLSNAHWVSSYLDRRWRICLVYIIYDDNLSKYCREHVRDVDEMLTLLCQPVVTLETSHMYFYGNSIISAIYSRLVD